MQTQRSSDAIYSRLAAGRYGRSVKSFKGAKSTVSLFPMVSDPIDSTEFVEEIGKSFSAIIDDRFSRRKKSHGVFLFPDEVEGALITLGDIVSASSYSPDPVRYLRFLVGSKRYERLELMRKTVEIVSNVDKPHSCVVPESVALKDGIELSKLLVSKDLHLAFSILRNAASRVCQDEKDSTLKAIAAFCALFGSMRKLIPVVGRDNLDMAVWELSAHVDRNLSSCSKSFLVDPDPEGAYSILHSLGIVRYLDNHRKHVARFDQSYEFVGATSFVLSNGEDLPDSSDGLCIWDDQSSTILINDPSSLKVPASVVLQHELSHHFDGVFSIPSSDTMRSETRAFTSELCLTSPADAVAAFRDLIATTSPDIPIPDKGNRFYYHGLARRRIADHMQSNIGHLFSSNKLTSTSATSIMASARLLLNSELGDVCGLTFDEIIEPFVRMNGSG